MNRQMFTPLEQNREPRNKLSYIWLTSLQQGLHNGERIVSSTNPAETTRHTYVKTRERKRGSRRNKRIKCPRKKKRN